MRLLLHCCCAPCSISVVSCLRDERVEPTLFWYNPNIHPYSEYIARKEALFEFSNEEKLDLIKDDNYGLLDFLSLFPNSSFLPPPSRCEACYKIRLEKTAQTAAKEGFNFFSTTLLVSPYQDHEAIKRICGEMALKYGVNFLYRDFRPRFREGQTIAKEKGFYMQKYCGCVFSEAEKVQKTKIKKQETGICKNPLPATPYPLPVFNRLTLLIGEENLKKLQNTHVLIFGAGGVGSWCAEALVRSCIGKIEIIDFDKVCETNINRQLQATTKTIGESKVEVIKRRLLEINPNCEVTARNKLFSRDNADEFDIKNADYAIDAIDMLPNKIDLIETACKAKVKLFSSMGMALKTDPSKIKTSSIWKTETCPLARLVRQGLKKRGFNGDFTAVYSDEKNKNQPRRPQRDAETESESDYETPCNSVNSAVYKKQINGSIVTVTATAGLLLANLVIQDALK